MNDITGKLVRDKIPEIIRTAGGDPVTYTAGSEEFSNRLREKLKEEVAEFLAADPDGAPEELADVLEVIHALAGDLGVEVSGLEEIRKAKFADRGGFTERIIWTRNR